MYVIRLAVSIFNRHILKWIIPLFLVNTLNWTWDGQHVQLAPIVPNTLIWFLIPHRNSYSLSISYHAIRNYLIIGDVKSYSQWNSIDKQKSDHYVTAIWWLEEFVAYWNQHWILTRILSTFIIRTLLFFAIESSDSIEITFIVGFLRTMLEVPSSCYSINAQSFFPYLAHIQYYFNSV